MRTKRSGRRIATWYFIGLEAVVACSVLTLAVFVSPVELKIAVVAFGLAIASIAVADLDRVRVAKEIQNSVDRLSAELQQLSYQKPGAINSTATDDVDTK